MNIVWFLIIGLIAGFLAGAVVKGHGFGLLGNLIVGVIGAVLGGIIFGLRHRGEQPAGRHHLCLRRRGGFAMADRLHRP